ncbi:T9SS type A sorting domain-containing protein [Hymenobacter sp. BT491]|uniref:Ig-like domain-containing protein n=1 Tax=Hymenobacter sp. BT491 TaxID=2766779 RepID=UPI001653BB6A|nr:T9SS type A sorting domain-containing protein [Hymenobacter sp. BT491]MBC6988655.1 T9SS type A sorting domain-containing protein [Hymenobacter sp. BT491]
MALASAKNSRSGGDFSLDFVAAGPGTYNHATGGGAYDNRTIGKTEDVVESLEGGDFSCGDIVTYFTKVTVKATAVGSQTIALNYSFLADATGQSGVALADIVDANVQINYGNVGGEGSGGTDSGITGNNNSTAALSGEQLTGPLFQSGSTLKGTVTVTGLEAGESVVVRVDVRIACDPGSHPTGNLQGAIASASVTAPTADVISVGNQTVPFKNVNEIIFPTCALPAAGPVCVGTTTTHTATSDVSGATYTWTITGNGVIVVGGSDVTNTVTTSSGTTSSVAARATGAGTYTLSVTISKIGFGNQACSVIVTVNPIPGLPGVNNVAYCVGDVASALTATGSELLWYTDATGGTGSATAPTPNTTAAGTFSYFVSQTTNGCESARAQIDVLVKPLATVTPGTYGPYCINGAVATLGGSPTGGTWSGDGVSGNLVDGFTFSPATAGVGPHTLTYSVPATATTCANSGSTSVTVNPLATVTPGTYGPLCVNAGPVTLASGGTWSGTGVILDNGVYKFSPATAGVGTFELTLSVAATSTTCANSGKTSITVKDLPGLPGVSNVSYCLNETAAQLTATGSNLLWYTDATGGTGSSTAPTPNTTAAGTSSYYVSQTTNECEGARAKIDVLVKPLATVDPGSYGPLCVNAGPVTLASGGTWSGTGVSLVNGVYKFSPTTAGTFELTFSVAATDVACANSGKTSITVNPLPGLPGVSNVAYCLNETAAQLTATGSNLLWYTDATGGTGSSTAPTPNTTAAGTSSYYVSQTNSSSCEGPRAKIDVLVKPLATVTPGTYSPVCANAGSVALAKIGTWSGTGVSGNLVDGFTFSPATAGVGTFELTLSVAATSTTCANSGKTSITVKPLPGAPSVSPVSYCQKATATALTATGTGLLWYTAATGGTGSSTAPIPSTATVGTKSYYVSQTTNGCEGPRAKLDVTINACAEFCTLTQGFYGSTNGKECASGKTALQLIQSLLTTDLYIGVAGRSLNITYADAACLNSRLPAGGTSKPLPAANNTFSNLPTKCTPGTVPLNNGRFDNTLLGQTISLGLNLRKSTNTNLAGLVISDLYMITAKAASCTGTADAPVSGSEQTFTFPSMAKGKTVQQLYVMANAALGDGNSSAKTLSDLTDALDAINKGFDACRILIRFQSAPTTLTSSLTTSSQLDGGKQDVASRAQLLNIFPNPAEDEATIEFSLTDAQHYSLQVFDAKGRLVNRVAAGQAEAGRTYRFQVTSKELAMGMYVVRLTTDKSTQTMRLIMNK